MSGILLFLFLLSGSTLQKSFFVNSSSSPAANIDWDNPNPNQCPIKKVISNLDNITKVEKLNIDIPLNTILERGQQKRFTFFLNVTSPLLISFSPLPQGIIRKLYLNQTVNLTRQYKPEFREIFFSCAPIGQYDLILISKKRNSIRIQVSDKHPSANWTLLNRSIPIRIRSQNRMQKKQMIIKWSKSQLDIHAIHYCLVINTQQNYKYFCQAVQDSFNDFSEKDHCITDFFYNGSFWFKQRDRVKKIDSHSTTVSCTGTKSQQILKGLVPNIKYYIDVFGIHSKLRNLTFLLKSTTAWFNRTHPNQLVDDAMTIGKISGITSVSIFSYKIPNTSQLMNNLKILILPCGGSQVDVKILKQRQKVQLIKDIYRPVYVTQSNVQSGERYIIRITPSSEDEVLNANRVGIAITTNDEFRNFPILPANISLFEIRSIRNCRSTTIAWYTTPETRKFRYCVIVFQFPNNNRSSIDHTNYCMDFGKKVTSHPQFYRIRCFEPSNREKLEHFPLLNLSPGESYLIYVTVNLVGGKSLPYESLRINVNKHCHYAGMEDLQWKNTTLYEY